MTFVVAELKAHSQALSDKGDRKAARLVLDAAEEIERLRAAAVGAKVGVRAALPTGWRWIAVYQMKSHWEYCIEHTDFRRCAGQARTEKDAENAAIDAARREDARCGLGASAVGVNVGVNASPEAEAV